MTFEEQVTAARTQLRAALVRRNSAMQAWRNASEALRRVGAAAVDDERAAKQEWNLAEEAVRAAEKNNWKGCRE